MSNNYEIQYKIPPLSRTLTHFSHQRRTIALKWEYFSDLYNYFVLVCITLRGRSTKHDSGMQQIWLCPRRKWFPEFLILINALWRRRNEFESFHMSSTHCDGLKLYRFIQSIEFYTVYSWWRGHEAEDSIRWGRTWPGSRQSFIYGTEREDRRHKRQNLRQWKERRVYDILIRVSRGV